MISFPGTRDNDLWETQTELILGKNGMVSFIIHPDYVVEPALKSSYTMLLGYLRRLREAENTWFALPSEIDLWWRARSKMSVVQHGDSFSIEGEGADRAELAFATSEDGRLVWDVSAGAKIDRVTPRKRGDAAEEN